MQIWEVLQEPSVWGLMVLLCVLSWVMQWVMRRVALMCQSVYVIPVPWGINFVVVFAYLFGFLEYRQVIILALAFLAAYPGIWYANYKFTQQLAVILKSRHVTRETTGIIIWAEEIRWVWHIKRWWRRITGHRLNDEIIEYILDYHSRNGFSSRYGIPIADSERDN